MCSVTVGVLGDICRAIEEQVLPYCDRVMLQLVQNLQSPEVHRNIKPQILSAFGDIALAIGDKFVVSWERWPGGLHDTWCWLAMPELALYSLLRMAVMQQVICG